MKKIVSLLLTLIMCLSMTAAFADVPQAPQKNYPQNFWDVPKDYWAFPYIAELTDRGAINGNEDGSFRPDNTVTRAEWAKIMVLAAGLNPSDNNVYYKDMADHWANIYVNTAKDYLAAYTDGTFKPDQAAVREDVTVSMVKLKGYDVTNVDYSYLSQFTDPDSVSSDLKKYIAAAVEKGLINGFEDNTFRGQATLTRAEAATILWRAFQYGNDNKVASPSQTQNIPPTSSNNTLSPTAIPSKPDTASKPKNTPKPATNQSQPDPNPTAKPTAEPTPEPTAEPTKKPYIIDTVINADVKNSDNYTQDRNGNIYYAESGKIYFVDTASRSKEEIFDTSNLIIDNDEMTLSDFEINSICYDDYENRVLIYGKYKNINAANKSDSYYLYEIKDGTANLITDDMGISRSIVGVLSNGDYVFKDYIVDHDTLRANQFGGWIDYGFYESGNNIYFIDNTHYYISHYTTGWFTEYNYVEDKVLWNTCQIASGIINDKITIIDDLEVIKTLNFSGKELNKITSKDYEVSDIKTVDFSRLSFKLIITSNDDIIFYDTSAKAFRIISKNN